MDKPRKPARRQPKAYQDTRFLESKDARALRILAKYLEPLYRFQRHNVQDTIVFMGSARLLSEEAAKTALAEAERAGQGITAIVYPVPRSRDSLNTLGADIPTGLQALARLPDAGGRNRGSFSSLRSNQSSSGERS